MHGKRCLVRHDDRTIFEGLPQPLPVARYNSLVVDADGLPDDLQPCAWSTDGELMALRHRQHPFLSVQFHPESHLAPEASALLERWVASLDGGTAGRSAASGQDHSVRLMT